MVWKTEKFIQSEIKKDVMRRAFQELTKENEKSSIKGNKMREGINKICSRRNRFGANFM